jgi:hypothetical protein
MDADMNVEVLKNNMETKLGRDAKSEILSRRVQKKNILPPSPLPVWSLNVTFTLQKIYVLCPDPAVPHESSQRSFFPLLNIIPV